MRFSLLTVLDANSSVSAIARLARSLQAQRQSDWAWILIADNSDDLESLKAVAESEKRLNLLKTDSASSKTPLNQVLAHGDGEVVIVLSSKAQLAPSALRDIKRAFEKNPDWQALYTDSQTINEFGQVLHTQSKPDISPEYLLTYNYISESLAIKRETLQAVGSFTEHPELDALYALSLELVNTHPKTVGHLAKPLFQYEGSFSPKNPSNLATVQHFLNKQEAGGQASLRPNGQHYRVKYPLKSQPLVSILLPFKDKPELLDQCLESLLSSTPDYPNWELIGINNQSAEPLTYERMATWRAHDSRIRFIDDERPFNYAAINNTAAQHAQGDVFLMLNNDIELITPGWLTEMLTWLQRPGVGLVGTKLLYPNRTVQHAGVIVGLGTVAGHPFVQFAEDDSGYEQRAVCVNNVSAVTGACLMVRKADFNQLNGLDETLTIDFNDIDFCLRLQKELDLRVVMTPHAQAIHHESLSRGKTPSTPEQKARYKREKAIFLKRHAGLLKVGDPYYNPNLSLMPRQAYQPGSHKAKRLVKLSLGKRKRLSLYWNPEHLSLLPRIERV